MTMRKKFEKAGYWIKANPKKSVAIFIVLLVIGAHDDNKSTPTQYAPVQNGDVAEQAGVPDVPEALEDRQADAETKQWLDRAAQLARLSVCPLAENIVSGYYSMQRNNPQHIADEWLQGEAKNTFASECLDVRVPIIQAIRDNVPPETLKTSEWVESCVNEVVAQYQSSPCFAEQARAIENRRQDYAFRNHRN